MADYEDMTPGQLLADLNVAEFVKQLGLGVAEAQRALDNNSIEQAIKLANVKLPNCDKSLLELGLIPVFYSFTEATMSVNMHLSFKVAKSSSIGLGVYGSYGQGIEQGTATITVTQSETNPVDGDTVSVGSVVLIVAAVGEKAFKKGTDANETARNLATTINTAINNQSEIGIKKAKAVENVVTITGDPGIKLETTNPSAFDLSSDALLVSSDGSSAPEEKNVPVAFGGTFDVRQSRQFAIEMEGNSSITARLVALPPPVELLNQIRKTVES